MPASMSSSRARCSDGEAVGDVVHLIAELIENATSFSPPTARVLVSGDLTSSGYVLAVSDAGIGMGDAEIRAANATLTGQESADIEAGGMLGLHVVARLAARYDMRVWIQRGQDSGLSALVALPAAILQAADSELPPAMTSAPPVDAPAPLVPRQSAPLGADTQSGTTNSSPSVTPTALDSAPPAPAAVAALAAVPSQAAAAPLTAAGLQRRVPRASLAAPLSQAPAETRQVSAEPPIAPERARSVLSAYVGGANRARHSESAAAAESSEGAQE